MLISQDNQALYLHLNTKWYPPGPKVILNGTWDGVSVSSLGIGFHGVIRLTINNLPLDRNRVNIVWWESVGRWLNLLCKSAHVDFIFKPMIDLLSDYGKLLHSPIWCLSTSGVCLTHLWRKYNHISKIENYFLWNFLLPPPPHCVVLHVWFIIWSNKAILGQLFKILKIQNSLIPRDKDIWPLLIILYSS